MSQYQIYNILPTNIANILDFSIESHNVLKICNMCLDRVCKNAHQFLSAGPIKRRGGVLHSGQHRLALALQTNKNCKSSVTPKFVTLCFVIDNNLNKTKPEFQTHFWSDFQTARSRCILTLRGYTPTGFPYCIPQ